MSLDRLLSLEHFSMTNRHIKSQFVYAFENKEDLVEIALFLEDLSSRHQFVSRAEGSILSIYTNDKEVVNILLDNYHPLINEVWEPENDEEEAFLKSNKNIIICKKLPLNNFKYKVYVSPTNKMPDNIKQNFILWADNFKNKISLTENIKRAFLEDKKFYMNWNTNYFYVSDKKTLTMVLLFLGSYAYRTDEFVLNNEIM